MKLLIGFAMAAIGIPVGWWALNKAVAGQDPYNWIWVVALVIAAIGVVTILARIRHWMNS